MSIDVIGKRIVHFPREADKFEFDSEVATIFPDMAKRSIPMYEEVHRLHVSLLLDLFIEREQVRVIDVGASRGEFFLEICNQLQWPLEQRHPRIDLVAIDSSESMLKLLSSEMPWVSPIVSKVEDLTPEPNSQT